MRFPSQRGVDDVVVVRGSGIRIAVCWMIMTCVCVFTMSAISMFDIQMEAEFYSL